MYWFLEGIKNYATFYGRASRKEYWMFVLFFYIFYILLSILGLLLGIPGVLEGLYSLALLLPGLAISVRRLHDTDRSGWWMLIGLIPLIGAIVLIVFFVQDSSIKSNRFGANPKT